MNIIHVNRRGEARIELQPEIPDRYHHSQKGQNMNVQQKETQINFVSVGRGHLAIGHRPKLKVLKGYQDYGVTDVVTILGKDEGALRIGSAVQAAQLAWHWIPLANAIPPTDAETIATIRRTFAEIREKLDNGAKIFLHCSAGIHRTGMLTHALLCYLGYSPEKAIELLGQLRTVTHDGVGDERITWGWQFSE